MINQLGTTTCRLWRSLLKSVSRRASNIAKALSAGVRRVRIFGKINRYPIGHAIGIGSVGVSVAYWNAIVAGVLLGLSVFSYSVAIEYLENAPKKGKFDGTR